HFPISLLIFAGFLELFTFKNFKHPLRPGIRILALAGAVSAIFSAVFGLLLANNEGVTGQILDIHQWIGIVSAGVSLVLLFFLRKRKPKTKAIPIYRTLLFISGIVVGLAGHFGASLTHGEDFLTEVLPRAENDSDAPESLTIDLATFTADISPDQEIQLVTNVRSVLAHNCYKCHSGAKIEGELRLDEKEFVFAGGENGPVIKAGNPAASDLIRRISLPKNHDDVMPSKGKLLSKDEIKLLTL